jgi:hypothetical protein
MTKTRSGQQKQDGQPAPCSRKNRPEKIRLAPGRYS